MSHHTVTVTDVARRFASYLNRVAFKGEHFILTRGRKAVAELRPATPSSLLEDLPALLEGLPRLSEEDAADFEKDVRAARDELRSLPPDDRWAS
jgi:antitoxin (DNA-binding transcriptional repressor) of toxin-antitoxin stability system